VFAVPVGFTNRIADSQPHGKLSKQVGELESWRVGKLKRKEVEKRGQVTGRQEGR
jgi:hypothetical protein